MERLDFQNSYQDLLHNCCRRFQEDSCEEIINENESANNADSSALT